jgi:hypothetical protein
MERSVRILLGLASLVLAVVALLAFHDVAEAHTVRDWLTLVGAVLVWSSTALSLRPVTSKRRGMAGISGA